MEEQPIEENGWQEEDSETFIDFGHFFVPERELQIETIADLMPERAGELQILELACGEGLLAGALLQRYPNAYVHGYDGSLTMLQKARANLASYGERFGDRLFDMAATDWRELPDPVDAVVSSLAIHHLDDAQKRQLYSDVFSMLTPGGVFLVADIIRPANARGRKLAAKLWDREVERRSWDLGGDSAPLDFFRSERWNYFEYDDPMDKPSLLHDQLCWLEEAGFVDVDVYWMKAGHAIFGGVVQGAP